MDWYQTNLISILRKPIVPVVLGYWDIFVIF
nr:MAG TPA: hypothetical protein [Caudoviricetes sp.]